MKGLEFSLAVIKPDGMQHKDEIIRRITDAGFVIVQSRSVRLSAEQASEFYRSKESQPNYHAWIVALSNGPVHAMCVSKSNAVTDLLILIGPEKYQDAIKIAPLSLRAMFANSQYEMHNAIHGSENRSSAHTEIKFFFPTLLEPIFIEQNLKNYLSSTVNTVLLQGLYAMAKERPTSSIMWLSNWLLINNPYKPKLASGQFDPLYEDVTKSEDRARVPNTVARDHVGAQSRCDCSDYEEEGFCSCSFPIINKAQ
ncbi:nucleoside diphosphate kinase homolog 5-like [Armigeres subalbatus]|uniref:nucleoside diphosphate kinase homolog 5-like n=1 Tax=Armigeres subalbatus TaxID=124917 RepID=UPI002ED231FA